MKSSDFDFLLEQDLPRGALYVVATPIGNMGDITLRALHVLNLVDGIACEDTRHSAMLLNQFEIRKPLIALHEHNEIEGAKALIKNLQNQERWAYISDAGTPSISDPGAKLVAEVILSGFRVIPIPGASAIAAAVSVAGSSLAQSEGRFQFLGFLSTQTKEFDLALNLIATSPLASIFYETPHRIEKTLLRLYETLSPDRLVFIARELSKKFEELVHIRADAIPKWLENANLKGEFVVIVSGCALVLGDFANGEVSRLAKMLTPYLGSKELSEILADYFQLSKKESYQIALKAKPDKIK
ncbi:MAG: rRNA ((1402)-2-O)-methyltransferase [Pseudomonadota bacterium]